MTLKVEFNGGCSTSANNNATADTRTFYIRSVTNQSLGPLTLNGSTSGNLEFGSTTPVTLEVPLLAIPRNQAEPNPTTIYAEGYEWTIPSGWRWPDGAVSNGAPRLFNLRSTANANRIQVTPSATTCGNSNLVVRVRAVDTECAIGAQLGYTPTRSAEKALTVNCITPPLTIISNRTPQGGPISLFCGERLESEQVRPSSGPMPGDGSFSSYSFTTSGVVSSSCCLTTATPGLYVRGAGTGSVSLGAVYTRNGVSTTVAAPAVVVTVRPETAPVTLRPIPVVCPGQPLRVEVTPVPGAAYYKWTIPSPFSPAGIITTTEPHLDLSSPASRQSQDFVVQVEAGNGTCTPSTDQKTGKLGAAAGYLTYWGPGLNANATPQEVCGSTNLYVGLATDSDLGPPTDITWTTTDGASIQPDMGTGDGHPQVVVRTPVGGYLTSVGIYCRYTDGCGESRSLGLSFTVVAGQRSDGAYCGMAYEPRLFPNPAGSSVTVSQSQGGEVIVYDTYGRQVLRQAAQAGSTVLSLDKLPEGLYYVQLHDARGRVVRRRLEVRHNQR